MDTTFAGFCPEKNAVPMPLKELGLTTGWIGIISESKDEPPPENLLVKSTCLNIGSVGCYCAFGMLLTRSRTFTCLDSAITQLTAELKEPFPERT